MQNKVIKKKMKQKVRRSGKEIRKEDREKRV